MEPKLAIRDELLGHAPGLRRFALSLCGTIDRAEDLVQDTFLQALTHLDSFQPGTNLAAWLVTILRNQFRDQYRKRQREVEDADGHYAGTLNNPGGHRGSFLQRCRRAVRLRCRHCQKPGAPCPDAID
jgi:RNA polymerase sigma-70 factor (ECF subfamily)